MLDAILVLLIIATAVIGVYRGCGKILFDFLALLGALWIDSAIFVQASHSLRVVTSDRQNASIIFAMLFVSFGGIGLVLSHIAYESILLSLGMLDKVLGLVLGIGCGIILCHAVVRTMDISYVRSTGPSVIASSAVGREMLDFGTYHGVIDDLYNATGGHRVVQVY